MSAYHARHQDAGFNPAGTRGFAFVEFTSTDTRLLHRLFKKLGFHLLSRHRHKPLTWYRQGEILFLVNDHPYGFTHDFEKKHGSSACAMGFEVTSANRAYQYAIKHGARACKPRMLEFQIPAIYGIGKSLLYFVDKDSQQKMYEEQFCEFPDPDTDSDVGLKQIDHLTHNVYRGHMDQWANFYKKLFNFHEIRYFKIQGKYTGLLSRAMTSPCGNIKIPINESRDDQSQIEEFLHLYNGEGIQHIALTTEDIVATVTALKKNGLSFMSVPDTYYEQVDNRFPGHSHDVELLREHSILIDGHKEGDRWCLLLQIFTDTLIGPIFFEIIQRLGDNGFGEGNFQALFEAIERDQIRRGILKSD